jgi:hypothetical protein
VLGAGGWGLGLGLGGGQPGGGRASGEAPVAAAGMAFNTLTVIALYTYLSKRAYLGTFVEGPHFSGKDNFRSLFFPANSLSLQSFAEEDKQFTTKNEQYQFPDDHNEFLNNGDLQRVLS